MRTGTLCKHPWQARIWEALPCLFPTANSQLTSQKSAPPGDRHGSFKVHLYKVPLPTHSPEVEKADRLLSRGDPAVVFAHIWGPLFLMLLDPSEDPASERNRA